MDIGIKKYEGILEGGIAVQCTLIHEDKVYEALYWYDDKGHDVLSVRPDLEELIGSTIEDYSEYQKLIDDMKNKVSKYDDVISSLNIIA